MRKLNKQKIKAAIKAILERLISAERPIDTKGNLDIVAFNSQPEVVKAKDELRKLGITTANQLADMGFLVAGLTLKF